MPSPPIASFLLPVRNGLRTLPHAIESIIAQTVTDWELIAVNDGSDDGSGDWLDEAARGDRRICVMHTDPRGIVAALNAGAHICNAPFIARMDADDIATPRRLQLQLHQLQSDASIGVVDGQVSFFRDDGPVPDGMRLYGEWVNDVLSPADFDRELLVESPIVHPAATIRRSAFEAVGGYRDGPFPEDYDLWLRLHSAGWRLQKIPELLVHMRDRAERLTRTDPRYGRAGFVTVRQDWLSATVLDRPRRVVLWGAGKQGRPWLRWLLQQGHHVPALIDIDPKKIGNIRQGSVPIVLPQDLPSLDAEILLVAVGARGARAEIRAAVSRMMPMWTEGRHWWCLR